MIPTQTACEAETRAVLRLVGRWVVGLGGLLAFNDTQETVFEQQHLREFEPVSCPKESKRPGALGPAGDVEFNLVATVLAVVGASHGESTASVGADRPNESTSWQIGTGDRKGSSRSCFFAFRSIFNLPSRLPWLSASAPHARCWAVTERQLVPTRKAKRPESEPEPEP